jgi:small subunit ribosomal protein S30
MIYSKTLSSQFAAIFGHLRYEVKMLKIPRVFRKNFSISRRFSTAFQEYVPESEWTDAPQYPPIVDNCYPQLKQKRLISWHEKIKKIETIEEKMIEINMPKYYGYKSLMLDEKTYPYNTLPFFQYATNTEFIEENSLTPANEADAKKIENFLNLVRSEVQDAFEFELDGYR